MNPINKRYEFALLFDVTNGNPNGDPDAGNAPRIDPETGKGFVSDVCLKRKIRDFVTLVKNDKESQKPEEGYDIYVKIGGVLERSHREAYKTLGLKEKEKSKDKKKSNVEQARDWMCEKYYDIRTFGGVLTLDINCGQVRGPVQIAFAQSVDPITPLEQSIVRKAVATEREAGSQIEKHGQVTGTFGRKEIIPYALYEAHGFISPYFAEDTGFSNDDLEILWEALKMMFEHDRSSSRGEMSTRKLIVFEHDKPLGCAPAHKLFDRINIERSNGSEKPARSFGDYTVKINKDDLPEGITIHEML